MGKKCIPGIICIENMTLFIMIVILIVLVYLLNRDFSSSAKNQNAQGKDIIVVNSLDTTMRGGLATRNIAGDTLNDQYVPPLSFDTYSFPVNTVDVRGLPQNLTTGYNIRSGIVGPPTVIGTTVSVPGVPINVPTQGYNLEYRQIGILTKQNRNDDMILPLMGRRIMNGRDKWQYYTMTTTGNMNTKLPISVNGRSCMGDIGCDSISNGDVVYVEGYNDIFKATVYENGAFSYLPVI